MKVANIARSVLKPFKGVPRLYRPNYERNVFSVLPTAFEAVGVKTKRGSLFDNKDCRKKLEENECRGAKNVVFIMIDSCGIQQFASSNRCKRLFKELGSLALSSVFPTTTSTVVTSIACGRPPEEHGIVGHSIYIEEIGAVVDTLRASVTRKSRDSLWRAGVDLEKLVWSKPLHYDLDEEAIYVELLPWGIARTGLSHFLGVERNTVGFVNLVDAFSTAKKVLKKFKDKKVVLQVYIHELDSLGHKYGPYSKEYRLDLRRIERNIIRFIRSLRGKEQSQTVLMLLSDHGQDRLEPSKTVKFTWEEAMEIGECFRIEPIGTSGRVRHFYVSKDRADEFVESMEERINGAGVLLSYDEVERELWKGVKNRKRARTRMGDYLFVPLSGSEIRVSRKVERPPALIEEEYVSSHGSLTLNELVVPFFAARVPIVKKLIS